MTVRNSTTALRVAIGPSSFAEQDSTPLEFLRQHGVEVVPNPYGRRLEEKEIIAHLRGVDGLIAGLEPLNQRVLSSAAPKLRALARVGIGMTNVDQEAARACGIRVSNTPDEPALAVAEMTLAALLAIARDVVPANEALHQGKWRKVIAPGLAGQTVLLVGYGRIGRRVGELLRAFGARVLVSDPALRRESLTHGEQPVDLATGLGQADVVSLHAAGEALLLGEKEFAGLKRGAVLLNSARAELVDEGALLGALDDGRVRAAWFDVFWKEPYSGPLTQYPQVLLTPHVSTYTAQCRRDMELAAARNLLRDLGA